MKKGANSTLRMRIRQGEIQGPTSGLAPGFVQCNIVIVPLEYAEDFQRFCQQNPKPCPLLATNPTPGAVELPELAADIDIRTDLPRYRVWQHGKCVDEPNDVRSHWRDDAVVFALGCSFSFEEALTRAGIEMRHISQGCNVPMYRTDKACARAGVFSGNLVVSMRPLAPGDVARAHDICADYPGVHGAPIHAGDPAVLGITDINSPDFGDAVNIKANETTVFWACGVTPQIALEHARLPWAITHAPGHMLVTDTLNTDLAVTSP